MRWTTLAVFGNRGITWFVTLVIARVLVPSEFGLVSISWIAYAAAILVRDQVVTGTVVFGLAHDDTSPSVLWVATGTSAALGLLMVAASPLLSDWTGHYALGLLVGLAIALLVSAVGSVPSAYLLKGMRFRLVTLAEVSATVVFAVSALACLASLGPLAVGVGQVCGALTGTVIVVAVSGYRPRRTNTHARPKLVGYGVLTVVLTLLTFCFTNLDTVAVAIAEGGTLLGVYSLAFNIAYVVTYNLGLVLGRVMFPAYALSKSDPVGLARMYVSTIRLVVVALIPITIVLAVVAPELVTAVFGDRYAGAVGPLRWLAFYGAAAALTAVGIGLMRATGRLVPAIVVYLVQTGFAVVLLTQLVPTHALVGAAASVTIAAACGSVAVIAIGFRQVHAGVRSLVSGSTPVLVAGLALAVLAELSTRGSLAITIVVTLVACAGYLLVALRTVPESRWFEALLGRGYVPAEERADA